MLIIKELIITKRIGMSNFDRLMYLLSKDYRDVDEVLTLLSENEFSKEELMRIAIRAVQTFELFEIESEYARKMMEDNDDDIDENGWYIRIYKEYDSSYVERINNHPMIKILEMLLTKGLDPMLCVDGEYSNVMLPLQYVDVPFLAATAMKLLLEHGASPYVKNSDGVELFEDIDADIAIDIDLLPESFVQSYFQCWLVLIGYGARPKSIEPFQLNPGHNYDELKEFEFFDWKIRYEPDKKENILHITDIRTGDEIGTL